ncbi:MAG TPA: hypothetical protein VLI05_06915 [Candidatus Saccharimonadia bacterium]|nr:hypothetical protein [Candidatus Saccharimonadia bacterium]
MFGRGPDKEVAGPSPERDSSGADLARELSGIIDARDGRERGEQLPREDRVMIYGSRTSGGPDLARDFETYLQDHGIGTADVQAVRFIGDIQPPFFYHGPEEQRQDKKSLPRGVVMMPYMVGEMGSGAEFVTKTPYEAIEAAPDQGEKS